MKMSLGGQIVIIAAVVAFAVGIVWRLSSQQSAAEAVEQKSQQWEAARESGRKSQEADEMREYRKKEYILDGGDPKEWEKMEELRRIRQALESR